MKYGIFALAAALALAPMAVTAQTTQDPSAQHTGSTQSTPGAQTPQQQDTQSTGDAQSTQSSATTQSVQSTQTDSSTNANGTSQSADQPDMTVVGHQASCLLNTPTGYSDLMSCGGPTNSVWPDAYTWSGNNYGQ